MRESFKNARDKVLQLWEQATLLHQRLRTNPSWQLAWDLVKLVFRLTFQLVRLYILFH